MALPTYRTSSPFTPPLLSMLFKKNSPVCFFKIYLFIVGFGGSSLLRTDFNWDWGREWGGLLFLAVRRLLIAVASLVAEHRL